MKSRFIIMSLKNSKFELIQLGYKVKRNSNQNSSVLCQIEDLLQGDSCFVYHIVERTSKQSSQLRQLFGKVEHQGIVQYNGPMHQQKRHQLPMLSEILILTLIIIIFVA